MPQQVLLVWETWPEENALIRLSEALVNYQAIELCEEMPKGLNIVEVIRAGVIL